MNDRVKRIRDYKTELVFTTGEGESAKEKVQEMKFRTPSMAAQDEYIRLREEWLRDERNLKNEDRFKVFKDVGVENVKEYESDPAKQDLALELSGAIQRLATIYSMKFYKASVDTRQLTTQMQEQFNEEPEDSEFWSDQDLVMIEDAVSFFREHLKV